MIAVEQETQTQKSWGPEALEEIRHARREALPHNYERRGVEGLRLRLRCKAKKQQKENESSFHMHGLFLMFFHYFRHEIGNVDPE